MVRRKEPVELLPGWALLVRFVGKAQTFLKAHWPIVAVLGAFGLSAFQILEQSLGQNADHLVYNLDDAYIHMAMAKNFARYGVWGVTPYEFSSSSSALLWTFLLAAVYRVVGPNEVTPFVFGLVSTAASLVLCHAILRRYHVPPAYGFLALLALYYFTPMPTLVFSGMEHPLQILVTLAFVHVSSVALAAPARPLRELGGWMGLAVVIPLVRYEGLFAVAVVASLCLVRKRWMPALGLTLAAAFPLLVYGWISLSQGWYFLPNSLLLKAIILKFAQIDLGSWRGVYNLLLYVPLSKLLANPHLLALLAAAFAAFLSRGQHAYQLWGERGLLLTTFLGTAYLHLLVAGTGWFYRYEAYLVAFGILTLVITLREHLPVQFPRSLQWRLLPRYAVAGLVLALVVAPAAERGISAWNRTARATTNIYEQTYQMALFLQTYYQGESVAINDIGATNYLADLRCLDLVGLASKDVAKAWFSQRMDTRRIHELTQAHKVRIAIVYDHWFAPVGGLPKEWVKVGRWGIQDNVVAGHHEISFYAVDPEEQEALVAHLREFSPRLPPRVMQSGPYSQ